MRASNSIDILIQPLKLSYKTGCISLATVFGMDDQLGDPGDISALAFPATAECMGNAHVIDDTSEV